MQVTRKGKSISPGKSPNTDKRFGSTKKESSSTKKVVVPHDYFILRISPCPAETLKDLVSERRWMFKCRNMLLYITHRLHQLKQVLFFCVFSCGNPLITEERFRVVFRLGTDV